MVQVKTENPITPDHYRSLPMFFKESTCTKYHYARYTLRPRQGPGQGVRVRSRSTSTSLLVYEYNFTLGKS